MQTLKPITEHNLAVIRDIATKAIAKNVVSYGNNYYTGISDKFTKVRKSKGVVTLLDLESSGKYFDSRQIMFYRAEDNYLEGDNQASGTNELIWYAIREYLIKEGII